MTFNYYYIFSIVSSWKYKCEKRIRVAYKIRRWRYDMLHIVHKEFIDWCKELRFALSLSDVSAWNLTWFANQKCEVTHSFAFSRSTSFYSSIFKYLGPSLPPKCKQLMIIDFLEDSILFIATKAIYYRSEMEKVMCDRSTDWWTKRFVN